MSRVVVNHIKLMLIGICIVGLVALLSGCASAPICPEVKVTFCPTEEKDAAKLELTKVMNEHLQAMEQEATKQLEQQVKEMDSARQRELQIAISDKAPTLNKIITPILAIVIIGLTFILFYLIMFKGVTGVEKDILVFVLGALTGYVGMVLSYYFGSSIGSAHKQNQIEKMIK